MAKKIKLHFTAGEVAEFFGFDLKSIHNWCDRKALPFFLTPGRQRRFKPTEIKTVMIKLGLTVPAEVILSAAHQEKIEKAAREAEASVNTNG